MIPSALTAIDTETWAEEPLTAPPLVCLTVADAAGPRIYLRTGLGTDDAIGVARGLLLEAAGGTRHLGGTNLVYDLGVLVAAAPYLLPLVFRALERGTLHSTDILEALHDNTRGLIYREANGTPIGRYSQALLEARYLDTDRTAVKTGADSWRVRYHELDGVPLAQWPQEAVDYPLDDARLCYRLLEIQLGEGRDNLQCEADEMRAAWSLQLARLYGMRTDGPMVTKAIEDMHTEHESSRRRFFGCGIVRLKTAGRDDTPDDIPPEWVRAAAADLRSGPLKGWQERRLDDLASAERALARGKGLCWATDTGRLAELVTEAYAGRPPTTETGRVSTARDTLVESGDETLEAFGEAGPNEKLLSTYADVLRQGVDAPIHPGYLSLVASGRTSYSRPNLQNLPREGAVRYSFVPRPGWVYCSVDYSALELCTLAQVTFSLFGASDMRDAINAGQDLHLRLAARIAGGMTYEAAMARLKARDPVIKNLRQVAKAPNFGLPGLMGPAKLVLTARKQGTRFCELSGRSARCGDNPRVTTYRHRSIAPTCVKCLELAEWYSVLWREEWPEVVPYLDLTPQLADSGKPVPSFGNGMLRMDDSPGAISNHFFQNLAAQGAKAALWAVTRECLDDPTSILYGNARPVVFVHDEIITEIRQEVAHECALRQAEIMIAAMRRYTPDVKISAVPALARRWFKGMEAVYDKAGRLRPWWPVDARKEWTWGPDQEAMQRDLTA